MMHGTRSNGNNRALLGAAAMVTFLAGGTLAAPPTIHSVGLLPGGTYSRAAAVTQDGQVVTGIADLFTDELWGDRAFRWTLAGGIQSLGTPIGLPWTAGNSIGGVGNAVAGNATNRAFRWTSAGGMQNLGTLPGGTLALAYGLSADGNVVVGTSNNANGFWGFRWTPSGGMVNLGALPGGQGSSANAVTPDGLTIVGASGWSGAGSRAYRWTSSGGFQNLGALPGGASSFAHAVNAAGTIIVGESDWSGTGRRATRWSGAGTPVAQNLGAPAGASDSIAVAVSADGQATVGYAIFTFGRRAMWFPGIGAVDLNTHLPTIGLPLTGWVLEEARGVSGDGSVIVGHGTFNGQQRGFVIRNMPCSVLPVVTLNPTGGPVCVGGGATLSVGASAPGLLSFSWEWREVGEPSYRPAVAAANFGPGPVARFHVSGSATTATLQVTQISSGADLDIRAVPTNPCGPSWSLPALLTICRADVNCDGVVDFNDFLVFLNLYNAGSPLADLNGDSVVDFNDFLEYLNLYNAGC
ncbi:MAG: hypothetical protein FJ255_12140 [Phycisphaerae bacterium]|nr:hypothetical protein [Phycisphaerae bacterium]